MTVAVPAVDDTVKVVDQSSEYRNKTGDVTQALGGSPVAFMVKFTDHAKPVRLRQTQIKVIGTANGTPVASQVAGNNPDGSKTAASAEFTPKNDERRDTSGAGYNPHDAQGTLGDSRPKLA